MHSSGASARVYPYIAHASTQRWLRATSRSTDPHSRSSKTSLARGASPSPEPGKERSEEHTSELQSRQYLVCRLLLEKKKNTRVDYGWSELQSTRTPPSRLC